VTHVRAHAKINLGLVAGPRRDDGLHQVATVLQRIDLADEITIEEADRLAVTGFEDTLVTAALDRLARAAGVEPGWAVDIRKEIPAASGLGGGSSDAAAALVAANDTLPSPLPLARLHELAAGVGADVPFFLEPGPKLAEGGGERLVPLDLRQDFVVVVAVPRDREKTSTADVYRRFDEHGGGPGFEDRRAALLAALGTGDLAALPPNDLVEAARGAPLAEDLRAGGAFQADLSGAGPAVYGLFDDRRAAVDAGRAVEHRASVWVTEPVW